MERWGALTDIDQDGFASAAFHGFPDMLKADPLSGDYGPNFFGHAWNTATYIVDHPQFGWLAFGGNIKADGDLIKVTPLDSFRTRVYFASLGLWLTLDSGTFEAVELNSKTGVVSLRLSAATPFTSAARLLLEQPAKSSRVMYSPVKKLVSERGAWVVPLGKGTSTIDLKPSEAQ